jgi:hypothetical protein
MTEHSRRPRRPLGAGAFLVIAVIVTLVLVGARLLLQTGPMNEWLGAGASAQPIPSGSSSVPSPSSERSEGDPGGAGPLGTTTKTGAPPVSAGARVPVARRVAAVGGQNGVQIYLHQAKSAAADHIPAILDYVVSLGANSVGLSFPIYTDGARPTKVAPGEETPSVQQVTNIVDQAHERGLRVMLRPIIDETNIAQTPGEWRGSIRPVDRAAWFNSYDDTIGAYFGAHADEFVLASELTSLKGESSQWAKLAERARKAFSGKLSYAFNWDTAPAGFSDVDYYGLDLYFALKLGDDATVPELAAGLRGAMEHEPAAVRQRLVVQEVGIPALSGMYQTPWDWGARGHTIKEETQGNWFAAACQAVHDVGAKGIYFWMLDSNVDPLTVAAASEPAGSFIGRLGEDSIKACFAR